MWRLAKSIDTLKREVQSRFKGTTVWTIGDQAHQTGYSDHNPNAANVVCAADFKGDGGMNLYQFVEFLRTDPHPNLRYVIFNRSIYQRKNGFEAESYHGSNPHTTHVHVSVGNGPDGRSTYNYDSSEPWGIDSPRTPTQPKPTIPTSQGWTDKLMSDLPTLTEGATGPQVVVAQALLNTWGARLKEDGIYGPATTRKVKAFQKSKKLTPDNHIGRNTWTKLVKR